MKYFALFFLIITSQISLAADTSCTDWVPNQFQGTCIFGDGEKGNHWTRKCDYGNQTCHPHVVSPSGGSIACDAETLCLGTEPGDIESPNDLLNAEDPTQDKFCTPWRPAYGTNTACRGGQRWVRACTLERVPTRLCSAESPSPYPDH
jgi:hypothetical protein